MIDQKYLLDDQSMKQFILNGVVTLRVDLPAVVFERMEEQTQAAVSESQNPGNDLLARVPACHEVLSHPAVAGVLRSILGATYRISAHRHCHAMFPAPAGSGPQWHATSPFPLHKDHGNSAMQARHRCRKVMAFFFPNDCTPDMGPTMIAPGSPYYAQVNSSLYFDTHQTGGPAGTIAIVHYDMWHGGTRNYSDRNRFLMKFLFERMDEPEVPSWNCADSAWKEPPEGPWGHELPRLWRSMWDWHCGRHESRPDRPSNHAGISRFVDSLRHEDETICLNRAYELGSMGQAAVSALLEKLVEESACSPRVHINNERKTGGNPAELYYSGFALAAMGEPAVPGLVELLTDERWWVRASAADTLAEMGPAARSATSALCRALHDDATRVRVHAAEALGRTRAPAELVAPALTERLMDRTDEDKPAVAVQVASAGALARMHLPDELALNTFSDVLRHEHRYVRYQDAVGLERVATKEARQLLEDFYSSHPNERGTAA